MLRGAGVPYDGRWGQEVGGSAYPPSLAGGRHRSKLNLAPSRMFRSGKYAAVLALMLVNDASCFTGPALVPGLAKGCLSTRSFSCAAELPSLKRTSAGHSCVSAHRMALLPAIPVIMTKIASISHGMAAGPFVAAATLPTTLGFWKSEYGVSYAYGLAMFLSGLLALPHCRTYYSQLHAFVYIFYGLRLNLFLLYREVNIPTFREFKEKIEDRAKAKGGRLTRTPFIVMCSLLYLGMAAPLQITAKARFPYPFIAKFLLSAMFFGGGIAALGDQQKTLAKVGQPNKLVTGGLFSILRHPNFTGEIILWTSSALLALATVISTASFAANAAWLALSFVGVAGINFVLVQAATGLEKRQKEKYGERPEYQKWVDSSWSGPVFPSK